MSFAIVAAIIKSFCFKFIIKFYNGKSKNPIINLNIDKKNVQKALSKREQDLLTALDEKRDLNKIWRHN